MVRFPKVSRLAVAAVLTVAAVGFSSGVSGAVAEPAGSLTDNGNGTVTLVFDDSLSGAAYFLAFLPTGAACPAGTIESPVDVNTVAGLAEFLLPSNGGPATLTVEQGLEVFAPPLFEPAALPAGDYQLCLYWSTTALPVVVSLAELEAEIGGEPEPTTTTTPAPTTTTVPDVKPATPRYTG